MKDVMAENQPSNLELTDPKQRLLLHGKNSEVSAVSC